MKLEDIDRGAVIVAIRKLNDTFYTKDLSEHADMLNCHSAVCSEPTYNQLVGTFLSQVSKKESSPIRMEEHHNNMRGQLWSKRGAKFVSSADQVPTAHKPKAGRSCSSVRPGHLKTLEYMASSEFGEIKRLFEDHADIGGVYFRPTEKGLKPVDLHRDSQKPLIGIGKTIKRGTTPDQLAAEMDERVRDLLQKRSDASTSREKQIEARLIREAQDDRLRLPGFPPELRFIHSQWRVDQPDGGQQQFTDLIAIHTTERRLVIIELKTERDNSAMAQVEKYVQYFRLHAEALYPFFARLGAVMGELYGCEELTTIEKFTSPAKWTDWSP